ncbi:hypothetical protein [Geomonas sp. Red276]
MAAMVKDSIATKFWDGVTKFSNEVTKFRKGARTGETAPSTLDSVAAKSTGGVSGFFILAATIVQAVPATDFADDKSKPVGADFPMLTAFSFEAAGALAPQERYDQALSSAFQLNFAK